MEEMIRKNVQELVELVQANRALEAFERHYAEDCTMQELDGSTRVGKSANLAHEREFLSQITKVRAFACDGFVVSGDTAFVVWRLDVDLAVRGTMKLCEVAIQRWREGKIVHERFVHAA
jgi:ketosteroid isomerase-like protein